MIIDCVSDLHGFYPQLPGGDLLIVAGDLTSREESEKYNVYFTWLHDQNYKKKVLICGNHDNLMIDTPPKTIRWFEKHSEICEYLCDSRTEFEGLKIWGSPWTNTFEGINPKCCAFTVDTDEELSEKWELIPEDIDILITHCPPFGIFDSVPYMISGEMIETGSISLRNKVVGMPNLKLHVFGHIHEHGGKILDTTICKFVNASHVNEKYKPVNGFVRIEL